MNKGELVFLIREIWGNAVWMDENTRDIEFAIRAERIMKICDYIAREVEYEVENEGQDNYMATR